MRQFNSPPGWPDPPTSRWRPPRRWRPPATWPKAPRSWSFWIDENGRAVRGPIGRYGGPGITLTAAIVLIPLALMAVVIINPLRNGESVSTVPSIATSSTRPKAGATTNPTTAPTQTGGTPSPLSEQTTPSSGTPGSSPTATPTDTTSTSVTPTPGTTSGAPTVPNPTVVAATAAPPQAPQSTSAPTPSASTSTSVVFKNCDEVRAAGKAPLHRGDPGYTPALDHNGDGVACGDRGNS